SAGGKRRDGHAGVHGLVGERTAERQHEGLCRSVGRLIGHWHETFERCDVENAAAMARDHPRQEAAGEIDHGSHIEIYDLAERRWILILEETRRHDRRVVHQGIGIKAVALERLLHSGAALRRAEVAREYLPLDGIS